MSPKFTAARREAFLHALAQTGNQTIAAERAKVSRSWVTLHRREDPAFRAATEAAIAVARAALTLRAGESGRAAPAGAGGRYQDGVELVVRGSNERRTQVARARVKQWTARVEERFLVSLAASCNVRLACTEVGMTAPSAYRHRLRWPDFAQHWDEAIEIGYIRIEHALIEAACNLFSVNEPARALLPEAPMAEMTAAHAIQLLHMHKHQVRAIGKRPGRQAGPPDIEAVRASILRKIEAIERWEAREGKPI